MFYLLQVQTEPGGSHTTYGPRVGIGWCYHVQTQSGACTIFNKRKKSSGARAIIKFAGDLQITKIVRRQFYLWP